MVTHASGWAAGTLLAIGVNHHTAPLEIRERLTLNADRWQQSLSRVSHLSLATCNRTEAYIWDTQRLADELGHAARPAAFDALPEVLARRVLRLDRARHTRLRPSSLSCGQG